MRSPLVIAVVLLAGVLLLAQDPPQPPPRSESHSAQSAASSPAIAKSRKKKKSRKRKGPRKVVVQNGSTAETGGTLSPGLSEHEAELQRSSTDELLQASQGNLKAASARQLTSEQLDTVQQVNTYIQQSHSASDEGDLQRAHNLALKARLLSDTLLHH